MSKGDEAASSALEYIGVDPGVHGSQLELDKYAIASSREQAVNREIVDWIKTVIVPALVSKFMQENNLTKP